MKSTKTVSDIKTSNNEDGLLSFNKYRTHIFQLSTTMLFGIILV